MQGHVRGLCVFALFVTGSLPYAERAHAAATAEQKCQAERAKAAGAYASCQQTALGKWNTTSSESDTTKFKTASSKCRVKYTSTWAKLQAKAALVGSSCAATRFVDIGDGTVTDSLTGLVWEKKGNLDFIPNLADPHDADNRYSWCAGDASSFVCNKPGAADGTVFTDFLQKLNSGACFAGQCDWRLPTREELQTILADPWTPGNLPFGVPCTTPSCIDAVFGATSGGFYWSATSNVLYPNSAWSVLFLDGLVDSGFKWIDNTMYARAVRGGL